MDNSSGHDGTEHADGATKFLSRLAEAGAARRLGYVVIGGYALIAWGVPKQAGDLDLFVPERSRAAWRDLLADLGYGDPYERAGFLQYPARGAGTWPVDLFVAGNDTFDRVAADAVLTPFGRATCPVASPTHLLAMKFHALRYVPNRVGLKDLADVRSLVRRAGGRVTDPAVRDLCMKYGSQEIYERLLGITDPV